MYLSQTESEQEVSKITRWFIDRLNADSEERMAGEYLGDRNSSMGLSCQLM